LAGQPQGTPDIGDGGGLSVDRLQHQPADQSLARGVRQSLTRGGQPALERERAHQQPGEGLTGGTGTIGRLVVRGLLDCQVPVRVLSRSVPDALPSGVEHVAADLTQLPGSNDPGVFDGVSQLFLFPVQGDLEPALKQAAAAGVQHVVVLSSLAAANEHDRDLTSASSIHHRAVEAAVAASGLPATILRPGTFATNLLFWAHSIRYTGGVDGPYPTSAQAVVHEADVADVAVAALVDDRHRGAIYPLTGPQALSQEEQLAAIATALGRPLTYRTVSPEQFTTTMTQWMPSDVVAMLLRYWAETVDEPDVVRSSAAITGRARSLAEWATDHVADFR
jgi:uncharacterized protein YbjT (DUF2867 family)